MQYFGAVTGNMCPVGASRKSEGGMREYEKICFEFYAPRVGCLRFGTGCFGCCIFGVASTKENVTRRYLFGLSTLPYFGWALGTLLGTLIGSIVSQFIMNALCLAIYGMFVAIITPAAKSDFKVLIAVIVASIFSIIFFYVPIMNEVPSGIAISISAILAALICAIIFPVKEGVQDE
jgi:predicted branched-subunit amino acid permease